MFQCHLNVEACSSIKSVKYIHKYIYKGHDHTTIEQVQKDNEVIQYLDSRYLLAPEAVQRILMFRMHTEVPKVQHLAIHLKNEQTILINPDEDSVQDIQQRIDSRDSTLMAFFKYN